MKTLNNGKIIFLIIVAVAMGLIYFLPNILIPHFYNQATGSDYAWRNMAFYTFEEAFSYGVSIGDVIRGHWLGGDPFLWEYKDMPTSWDYYPLAFIIGLFFKLFQLSDPSMLFVVGDFIFPPAAFIIIFLLFRKITKNYFFSILSSLIFLFFPNLFIFKKIFSAAFLSKLSFLQLSDLFGSSFNAAASRIFVPAITMIFLGIFLLTLYYSISEKSIKTRFLVLAGISYGLLFYIYFYYWVFATISLGFLSAFFLFYKRDIFWRIIRVFAYGLIVSIPYWIRFFILAGNPIYGEIQERIGLLKEKIFIWPDNGYWTAIFLFLGIIFWKRIKNKNLFFYIIALLLTILIVKNLQIVFGFNPQPDHWGSRINVYIIILSTLVSAFLIFGDFLERHKTSSKIFLCSIILFLITIATSKQIINSIEAVNAGGIFLTKDIRDSLDWINKNTEANSVFVTDSERMRTDISFHTHSNIYLPHACLSLASNAEIQMRYVEIYALYKIPIKIIEDSLYHRQSDNILVPRRSVSTGYSIFCGTYQSFRSDDSSVQDTPQEIIDGFLGVYKLSVKNPKKLHFKADYLYYGPYEKVINNFDPGLSGGLDLKYSNSSVKIYKIL